MLKQMVLALAVVMGTWTAGGVRGQVDPNGGGGFQGGPGGFQIDPAMLEQMQQMQQMGEQVMQNMQNAGVDPQQFFQEQMQNGGFDPQAMQQALVDKGLMTQDQANQMNNMMNQMQQNFQNMQGQGGATRTSMALNNIRQQLNVGDDEWNVLLPKIQRVLTVMADVQQNNNGSMSTGVAPAMTNGFGGGGGGGMGGGGGPGGGMGAGAPGAAADPSAAETPIARAWRELREVLADAQSSETAVTSKLVTWRGLHEAARSELDAAQRDLTQVLTLRQEAVLLRLGIL